MTSEEMDELKLSGVWKSGIGETYPMLIHVGDFQIGYDVWAYGMEIKAHVHAKVVKMTEGAGFPKRIQMVMPKTGLVMLIDSLFARGSTETFEVEATGYLYGSGSLQEEPGEDAILQKTITESSHSQVDQFLKQYPPIPQPQVQPWQNPLPTRGWKYGNSGVTGINDSKITVGDHAISVVEAEWMPENEFAVFTPETYSAMDTVWKEMVTDFRNKIEKGVKE